MWNQKTYGWTQITPTGLQPPPRMAHTGAMIDSTTMIIFGGKDSYNTSNSQANAFDDLWTFNVLSNTWEPKQNRSNAWPSARYGHKMACVPTQCVLVGGKFMRRNSSLNNRFQC